MTKEVESTANDKELYGAKTKPAIIRVPKLRFVLIEGKGDPNQPEFSNVTQALYSFSYILKMSYKGANVPEGYYPYSVFPLEGVWDLWDKDKPSTDKSNYKYTVMIRQPDFLTPALFDRFVSEAKKKKPNPYLDRLYLEDVEEGLCCQMLHVGPYDDEPASFALMEQFCSEQGAARLSKIHREIYLSDPRRTAPEKLKTILRFKVGQVSS